MSRYTGFNYPSSRGFASGVLAVIALFLVAAGGIAWVSVGIVANDRWPIRWLELNGAFQRVSAEQLRSSMTPLIDESFFTIDMQELHSAATRNSWVSSVRIQKAWPDTVTVTIEEYEPIAQSTPPAAAADAGPDSGPDDPASPPPELKSVFSE